MKGIGPATASAILSFCPPSPGCKAEAIPFLSDEALRFFCITANGKQDGKLDYTLKNWQSLQRKCEEMAEKLNAERKSEEDEQEEWTACTVERAIWADAAMGGKAN